MSGFRSGIQRWWRALPKLHEPVVPYSVECACGAVMTGTRKATSQIRICPVCKHKAFILGRSPFPGLAAISAIPGGRHRVRWRIVLPAVGAFMILALAGGIVGLIVFRGEPREEQARRAIAEHREAADKAWN